MFRVIPAIDIKGGRCVRLRQGRPDDSIAYSEDPVAVAQRWVGDGAKFLHVVDLDGAFQGKVVHMELIRRIARESGARIEVGGGIRCDSDIEAVLACGAERAIVGTRAVEDREGLKGLARRFGDRLAVAIDAREGEAQVKGWVQSSKVKAFDLGKAAADAGIGTLIYTNVLSDGMMTGIDSKGTAEFCGQVGAAVIASGGVGSIEDIRLLEGLGLSNLAGVIVGKSLYEGKVRLKDIADLL